MTKLEAQRYLFHKKVYLKNKRYEVIDKLSNLGFQWEDIDHIYLYIFIDSCYDVYGTTNPTDFYEDNDYEEISVEDLLKLEITSNIEYRPFKNRLECFEELRKHESCGWVQNDDTYLQIWEIDNIGIATIDSFMPYTEALSCITFMDNAPFGIKINK